MTHTHQLAAANRTIAALYEDRAAEALRLADERPDERDKYHLRANVFRSHADHFRMTARTLEDSTSWTGPNTDKPESD